MSGSEEPSIFERYYRAEPFVDRFQMQRDQAVDVIIPVIHTNEFWRVNLVSIYREIPVNRLIIGDGGCIDGSIDVAREFPRVEVLDHRSFTSLGYSLRRLIEATQTEWFVYLHSDVQLPPEWFDTMCKHREQYDWFECSQRITVLADYMLDLPNANRAFSGSQMGRKVAFANVTPRIDDDFLYRNEDIIIADLVRREGYRYGRVSDTFHFHQVMHKPSRWRRKLKRVEVHLDIARDEEVRANDTYVRGIVKYLRPEETSQAVRDSLHYPLRRLHELGETSTAEFHDWVGKTNPAWLPFIGTMRSARRERIADRVVAVAELYRGGGAIFVLRRVFQFACRRLRGMRGKAH